MFRLQDNVPQVYVEQSRDFQLFCRLYDCINNGVRYDINSMLAILDPMKVNDRLLNLMCTKVGFFTSRNYDSNILRHILVSFPYALKYKGSKQGIKIAVSAILKAESEFRLFDSDYQIDSIVEIDRETFTVNIYTTIDIVNKNALKDFLKYILPVGYTYTLSIYKKQTASTKLFNTSSIITMVSPAVSSSQIRGSDRMLNTLDTALNDFNFSTEFEDKYISTINAAQVIGSKSSSDSNIFTTANTLDIDRNTTNRDEIDKSNKNLVQVSNEIKEG